MRDFVCGAAPSLARFPGSPSRPRQARPNQTADDKAPDLRAFAGQTGFGAAWKKTSNETLDELAVELDDPSFPAGSGAP